MRLRDKVAIVTGGGAGVGRATALRFAEEGCAVVIADIDPASADAATAAIKEAGGRSIALKADVANVDQGRAVVEKTLSEFGALDILVNSASVFRDRGINETTDADWDENFAVNVTAPFILSRAMSEHLDGRPGKIINLTDWKTTRPKRFAYGVSKAALGGLTRSLAASLAPTVQVNEVALGAILLPVTAEPDENEALAKKLAARTPLGRLGTPEEVAHVVMTLVENDYITGETIYVDGGQRLSRT